MGKKIAIVGGTGFLGASVWSELYKDRGFELGVWGRELDELPGWAIESQFFNCDVIKKNAFDDLLAWEPEVVLYAVSMDHRSSEKFPELAFKTKAIGFRSLLENIERIGRAVRVINFSTIHVVGELKGNMTEDCHPEPVTQYALNHRLSEVIGDYVNRTSRNLSVVSIRLANVAGVPVIDRASSWAPALNDFSRQAALKQEIVLNSDGRGIRNFLALRDFVEAIRALVNFEGKLPFSVFHVAGSETASIREIAERVAEFFSERGGQPIKLTIPGDSGSPPEIDLVIESKRLNETVGWRATHSLDSIIEDIYAYFNQ